MSIRRNRYYQAFSIERASSMSGLDESEIVDEILNAVGETDELPESTVLFDLVSLLEIGLSAGESRDVLDYALTLYDMNLEDGDGDGPWSDDLAPPGNVLESLAGYIYSALASPVTTVRWEAAHSVLLSADLSGHAHGLHFWVSRVWTKLSIYGFKTPVL